MSRVRPLVWILLALAVTAAPARAAVEVKASLSRSSIAVGEATTLQVTVRGAGGGIHEPVFDVPPGVQVLGRGSARSFTWVSGQSVPQKMFRYEISATEAGQFMIGPIEVTAEGAAYRHPALRLVVSAEARRIGDSGAGPAGIRVDLSPRAPYVGEPVLMRVRLIQRQRLAEDPTYTAPPTPGFWAEGASQPESYYADEALERVLVTETRTRLYPLAAGPATVGVASAGLVLAAPDGSGALQWLRGSSARHAVTVRSRPVTVEVRALPPDAPAGFDGAVGDFTTHWSADRARTSRDVPVTVRLEVRGVGNLPLLRTPALASDDFEVFSSTTDDSFAPPGTLEPGMRAFQWSVLPHRTGTLRIPSPAFAWFDPGADVYRSAPSGQVTVEVGPPLNPDAPDRAGFPPVFAKGLVDPFARPAAPWGWVVAGLLLGIAVQLWRRGARRPAAAEIEAKALAVRLRATRDAAFWGTAEEVVAWLEARGERHGDTKRSIEAARYAGAAVDERPVRVRLEARLAAAARPARAPRGARAGAVAAAVVALGLLWWCAPHGGGVSGPARVRAGDHAARGDDLTRALRTWEGVWREGGRHPALAARLAWAEAQRGRIAAAVEWVLRGERLESRDAALDWVTGQIRETGGLVGYTPSRLPVRRFEWALAALALALGGALLWPRHRRVVIALLVAAVVCGVAPSVDDRLERARPRGVVQGPVHLQGSDLELEPGQVVRVLGVDGSRIRVRAGRGVSGWLPADTVATIGGRS